MNKDHRKFIWPTEAEAAEYYAKKTEGLPNIESWDRLAEHTKHALELELYEIRTKSIKDYIRSLPCIGSTILKPTEVHSPSA